MQRLRLRLEPEDVSIHPVADRFVGADYVDVAYAVHWNLGAERVTLMFLVEGDPEPLAADLADIEAIREFEVTPVDEDRFYLYLLDDCPPVARRLFDAFTQEGLLGLAPVVYDEDGVEFSVVGDAATLQDALGMVPDGVATTVERVGGGVQGREGLLASLSDRQREAVETAVALEYYGGPATVDDVAGEMDCAPSTAAEHLRKAEGKLVSQVVSEGW